MHRYIQRTNVLAHIHKDVYRDIYSNNMKPYHVCCGGKEQKKKRRTLEECGISAIQMI